MAITLIMFDRDGRRRDFPLKMGATTIGRKTDCDIRIPSPDVSRRHAEIITDEDGATVRDLGASNGTMVNNQRVSEEDFEPGDFLKIGPVIFAVQIDGEPDDEELDEIRTRIMAQQRAKSAGSATATSEDVKTTGDDVDPIAALEALTSSAEQTTIETDEEEDEEDIIGGLS